MSRTAAQILNDEYLIARAKILELAAVFDRLSRANAAEIADDRRLALLHQGIEILQQPGDDHAARVQLLFSRQYDPQWRSEMQV